MTDSLSFEQLFAAYNSNYSNCLMTQEQNQNLQVWHDRRGKVGITLSQADEWMMQAGLFKKKVLSVTDTGTSFSKLKQFSLNESQFMEYLAVVAEDKTLDLKDVKGKLLSAGLPKERPKPEDE